MSAGLTDSDTMFSVRETPWHRLGVVLDEPPGLGWSVAKEPIAVDRGDKPADEWWVPRCEEIPGFYATVRQDTREVLGIVGERYRLVQNHEAFTSSTSFSAARSTSRRPAACTAAAAYGCSRRSPITSKSEATTCAPTCC
jgi:hypothetical protein